MKYWWKNHAYHVLFFISFIALIALAAHWATYIHSIIRQSSRLQLQDVINNTNIFSYIIGFDRSKPPQTGPFGHDNRLEIKEYDGILGIHTRRLMPHWPGYVIQPNPEYLERLEKRLKSKTVMIIGESGVILLVILISGYMIYRIFRLEKRTTYELNEFWSQVTHEIKTPITGLKAFLQTIQTQTLSYEEMKPLIDLALKQVKKQQQLAENILMGQKINNKRSQLQLTNIDILETINDFIKDDITGLTAQQIDISIKCDRSYLVKADAQMLRIIFENLFDNAVKYSRGKITLTIQIKRVGKHCLIEFIDNGIGFEPGMEKYIFKAYKRIKEEMPATHGTGMGLHISLQLARRMGGNLDAFSQGKGMGSRFTIYLKIEEEVPHV